MRLATTLANETLDRLASRVYELPAGKQQAALRAARKALTDANPYLTAIGTVPPGTVILVPEVSGAPASNATEQSGPMIGQVAVAQLRGAIALAAQQLGDDLATELADARATAKLAQSGELRRQARAQAAELKAVAQAAQRRAEHAQELQRQHKQVFAQIEKDLAELVSVFG